MSDIRCTLLSFSKRVHFLITAISERRVEKLRAFGGREEGGRRTGRNTSSVLDGHCYSNFDEVVYKVLIKCLIVSNAECTPLISGSLKFK